MTPSNKPEVISCLIVEDNPFTRDGWNAVISSLDEFLLLGSFGSCEEALQNEASRQAHVVLMDIGLPGMSGIEGVRRIKERNPKSAIVMCSVFEDDDNIFNSLRAGAVGYIVKKTPPDELIRTLRDAAHGGSPMTPNIARKVISAFHEHKPKDEFSVLTDREKEVLTLMAQGKSYSGIANELFLSIDGVRYHIRHIYEKLQVNSRSSAVAAGIRSNLITPPR